MMTDYPDEQDSPSKLNRDQIVGLDSGPDSPFPLRISGEVISGFGRGSKELGVPTANIPITSHKDTSWIHTAESGVYFGWCSIQFPPDHSALTCSSYISSSRILSPDFLPPVPSAQFPESSLQQGWRLYPMVMSIGYNPYYNNEVRSAEVHVLQGFQDSFYGCQMRVCLLGFIRGELNYSGLEDLVADIKTDCEVAARSLARPNWQLAGERWSKQLEWLSGQEDI